MKGSSKYGQTGNCTTDMFKNFNLTEDRKRTLTEIANHSLSKSTWSTYKTSERMLLMCQKEENHAMGFPLKEEDIVVYLGWLLGKRKLKATTVNGYLSGLKQLHVMKGIEPPVIRTSIVNCILKGQGNIDNIKKRTDGKPRRLPMTMTMMKLLKETIRTWEAPIMRKLLMWSVCSLAFHGAFRIHELLTKVETAFDPDFSLLSEDITVRTKNNNGRDKYLEVKIKCPKESRTGKVVVLEVHESKGSLCPVKAFERWESRTTTEPGLPIFQEEDGTPLTGQKLNKWLKDRLTKFIDYKKGKFTSHSFRSGLATTLGTRGFSEEDIKEAGRWSSNAYEIYMKLPRTKRANVAEKIGKLER